MRKIHTEKGYITGMTTLDGEVEIYKGIPYAMPPIKDLRWKAPQAMKKWEGIKECIHFGPNAIQEGIDSNQPWMAPFSEEFWTIDDLTYSEDCLYLNVWTKSNRSKLCPVIVYIHGGGFGSGAGTIPIYDGENLARRDIVYVSINYRLGLFGFLANAKLSKESSKGISGNYGILDQIEALKWVQANIGAFGGDSDNVTIVGQSAGSASVQILSVSPYAKGLFKNVFAMSFTYYNGQFMKTQKELELNSQDFFTDMTIEDMRRLSTQMVLQMKIDVKPCVDGEVIPNFVPELFAEGKHNIQNLVVGTVSGDMPLFQILKIGNPFNQISKLSTETFEDAITDFFGELSKECLEVYPPLGDPVFAYQRLNQDSIKFNIYYLSKKISSNKQTNIYIYNFDHTLPGLDGKDYGAFHTADVPYWLGNLDKLLPERRKRLKTLDYNIGKKMMEYLINFVKTGNPNGGGVKKWYSCKENIVNHLYIGDDEFIMEGFNHKQITFWKKYYELILK